MNVAVRRPIDTGYERLKPGPGKSPDEVRESQRTRIHRAMIDLVAERGVTGVTVRGLTQTSGVSTRTFYAHFPDADECFAATYRTVMQWMVDQLREATSENDSLEGGIRAWITSLTRSAADFPSAVRLAFVDSYDGGPAMLREIAKETETLERLLAEDPNPTQLALARGIVAGVDRVVSKSLLEHQQDGLPNSSDELADWVLRIHSSSPNGESRASAGPTRPTRVESTDNDSGFAVFRAIGGDRGRILGAVAKMGAADGYWNLTAPKIRREANVPLRRFEQLFDGVADCYLEAIEAMTVAAVIRSSRSVPTRSNWPTRVACISRSLTAEVAASPLLAKLALTDLFAPGGVGRVRRAALIGTAAAWLCAESPCPGKPSSLAAEASAAAAWRVLQAGLAEHKGETYGGPSAVVACLILNASSTQGPASEEDRKHCCGSH